MKYGLTICVLTLSSFLTAQINLNMQFGGNKPSGDFAKTLNGKPFSNLSVGFGYIPEALPKIEIGGSVGVGMYAYKEYNHTFKNKNNETKQEEVYEDDCFFQFAITGKYFPLKNRVLNPYVGAQFGVNRFFSHIDPKNENSEFKGTMVWHGTSLQTGATVGLKVYLFNPKSSKNESNCYLTVEQSYLYGSTTKYRFFESDPETFRSNLNLGIRNTNTSVFRTAISLGIEF